MRISKYEQLISRLGRLAKFFSLVFGLLVFGPFSPASTWAQGGLGPGPMTHVPMSNPPQQWLAPPITNMGNAPLMSSPSMGGPSMPSPGLGGIGHAVDPERLLDTSGCTANQRRRAKKGQRCYVRKKAPSKKKVTRKKASPSKKSTSSRSTRASRNQVSQVLPLNEPNEVLATFPVQVSDDVIADVASQYRLSRIADGIIEPLSLKIVRYRVLGGQSLSVVTSSLESDTRVTGVQLNYVYQTSGSKTHSYPARLLKLGDAHALSGGAGVLVAVIDTAVDLNHPSLKDSIHASFDALGEKKVHPDPHGTVIAGIIAGHGKLEGVAPAAKILAIRAFQKTRDGRFRTSNSFTLLKSVDWAASNGAHVLNLSFAGPHDLLFERLLIATAEKGIIPVASVGNAGPKAKPAYPAAYESVLAVTAVDHRKRLFYQSVRGPHVAVAAPGVKILSAKPRGKYGYLTGTSMAAAHVSGVAALMLEKNSGLGVDKLRKQIADTALDLGKPGKDELYGYGLVNAYAAVKDLPPADPDQTQVSGLKSN